MIGSLSSVFAFHAFAVTNVIISQMLGFIKSTEAFREAAGPVTNFETDITINVYVSVPD